MSSDSDWKVLSAYLCPRGRLCECQHPGGEFACGHCRCDCPLPDPDAVSDNPDACPCCGRDTGP